MKKVVGDDASGPLYQRVSWSSLKATYTKDQTLKLQNWPNVNFKDINIMINNFFSLLLIEDIMLAEL